MKNLKLFRLGFATVLLGASLAFAGCGKEDASIADDDNKAPENPEEQKEELLSEFTGTFSQLEQIDPAKFKRGERIVITITDSYYMGALNSFLLDLENLSKDGEGYNIALVLMKRPIDSSTRWEEEIQLWANSVLTEITISEEFRRINPKFLEYCEALEVIHCSSTTYIEEDRFSAKIDQPLLKVADLQTFISNIKGSDYSQAIPLRFDLEGFDSKMVRDVLSETRSMSFKVILPDDLSELPDAAFYSCSNLREIVIPNTVKSIGNYAFQGTRISEIYIPDGVTYLPYCAFEGTNIKNLELPESVANWVDYEFSDGHLRKIKLPAGITEIPVYAFGQCSGLEDIEIPDGVTKIDTAAFMSCDNLKSITIPEGVTEIGQSAFWYCRKLTSIKLPSTLKTIGRTAFGNCGFKDIVIPEGVTEIKSFTFQLCENLETVTLPNSLEVMEDDVFTGSAKIKAIYCSQAIYDKYHDKYPKMVVKK